MKSTCRLGEHGASFRKRGFEKDIVRIGAEQERHLINRRYDPAPSPPKSCASSKILLMFIGLFALV